VEPREGIPFAIELATDLPFDMAISINLEHISGQFFFAILPPFSEAIEQHDRAAIRQIDFAGNVRCVQCLRHRIGLIGPKLWEITVTGAITPKLTAFRACDKLTPWPAFPVSFFLAFPIM
jgi:hypothetical protein